MNISETGKQAYKDKLEKNQSDILKILKFMSSEKYVSLNVLHQLMGFKSKTTTRRKIDYLKKLGLIESTLINSSLLNQQYFCEYLVIGLTKNGVDYCHSLFGNDLPIYSFEPSKIVISLINHTLSIQLIRAYYENKNYTWIYPENNLKICDGLVYDLNISIELELTIKSNKRYNKIISNYIELMRYDKYIKFNQIHYILPNKQFKLRLHNIFESFKTLEIGGEIFKIDFSLFNFFKLYTIDEYIIHLESLDFKQISI